MRTPRDRNTEQSKISPSPVDHSLSVVSRSSVPSPPTANVATLELIHALGKRRVSGRTICPSDHFPLHRRAGDSEREKYCTGGWVLPSFLPLLKTPARQRRWRRRRRILVREKVTKNWNGKSTECPFAFVPSLARSLGRWTRRTAARRQPKPKGREATSSVALTLM